MSDPLKPEVEAVIGGEKYQLRWDKRALYRLGSAEYADAHKDIDASNGPAMFRRVCAYAFCMLIDRKDLSSAEDVAGELKDAETHPLMEAVSRAIAAAQGKGEATDPFSETGRSQDAG